MKVCFDIWKNPHIVYQQLIDNPPVDYVYDQGKFAVGLKHLTHEIYGAGISTSLCYKSADLVHSPQRLLMNDRPYVLDVEHACCLANSRDYSSLFNKDIKEFITMKLENPNCKKILPFSEAAKQSLLKFFPGPFVEDKCEVVYPAYKAPKNFKKKESVKQHMLFVGNKFLAKGGLEALETFDALKGKFDVRMSVVTNDTLGMKIVSRNYPDVALFSNLPYNKLIDLYKSADLFLFPLWQASFGVYLEAMAYKCPVVSTDMYDIPEIVRDGKEGLLVKPPFCLYDKKWFGKAWLNFDEFEKHIAFRINECYNEALISTTKKLLEDGSMKRRMQQNCYERVAEGPFSIKDRNKKLKKIYEEAL